MRLIHVGRQRPMSETHVKNGEDEGETGAATYSGLL